MNSKSLDSIKKFTSIVPTTVLENLFFRKELHSYLADNPEAQSDYLALLKVNPVLAYDTLFFTYNPDLPIGTMNVPFIVSSRPKQVETVLTLKEAVDTRVDVGINKGRKEGATEILMKFATYMFLFFPDISVLVGSRSEELVDKTGDPSTLFAKIDYTIRFLPLWLKNTLHWERNFKHIKNLDLNATIDGEATNENFGAGKRVTFLILDEFGRVFPTLAQSIADTVRPISECVIYNSTHWFGPTHAFNKLLQRKDIKKCNLFWYDNPIENKGLYYDNESGEWPLPMRSPWFDKEVARSSSRRDVMVNIWGDPCGSSDMFFDPVVNARIRSLTKQPKYQGELCFEVEKKKIEKIDFRQSPKKTSLKIWSDLIMGKEGLRPNQFHNYIIGCDVGFGTGASNSVAEIVDVNKGENIGELVCSDKSPEEFADLCVALCKWVGGGTKEAFIIFENNGGQGANFGKRIKERGLNRIYTQTTETSKTRKQTDKFGWHSSRDSKEFVLSLLNGSLKEGLKDNPQSVFIKTLNEEMVNDLDSFIFYESGEIDAGELQDLNSGARKRHGDRVIGLALCVLGMRDQRKMKEIPADLIPYNSIAWRRKNREQREKELKDTKEGWNEPRNGRIMAGW